MSTHYIILIVLNSNLNRVVFVLFIVEKIVLNFVELNLKIQGHKRIEVFSFHCLRKVKLRTMYSYLLKYFIERFWGLKKWKRKIFVSHL